MNKKLLSVSLLLVGLQSYSQVGIGTLTPNQSAQLDVVSNNKGILIPRVGLTSSKDASTIQKGNVNSLLVFNTNTQNDVTPGYYYWYDDRWMRIVNDAGVVALDKNTTNQSLTVVGGDLVLTDSDGNMVSVPITDLNIPETVTTIVDNGTSFTYTNELNKPVTIDLLQGPVGPQGPIGLTGPAGADGSVVTADNGLNKSTATNIQLGGALLKATEIATNAAHTLAISGLQPGSATDEIVVVGTDGVLKKVAQTTGVNIYNADGTLTGNRTVTQNNQNLTFTTGTARTIVNGNFQMGGAVYANVRTHSASTNVAWTDTDYVVILTNNGITGTLELPNPTLHSGRILSIRNNTGSLVAFGGPYGSNTIPLNNSTIASGSGYTYISDGTNWHPTGSR